MVANQSGASLGLDPGAYPFPLHVLRSEGGASRGRNDGLAALDPACEVVAFPNDDSTYDPGTTAAVLSCFAGPHPPAAVACRLLDPRGERLRLPPPGTLLTRRTVWRAIEPATFFARGTLDRFGGFRPDLGTGSPSHWGSGEGTDLLLRVLAGGGRVVARPDITVHGAGERRGLDEDGLVAKHRAYARGTGYVYRLHGYGWYHRLRTLAGPLVKAATHDDDLRLSLRLARARSLGRLEGLSGRVLRGWPRRGVGRRRQR